VSAQRALIVVLALAGAFYLWNSAAQQAFWGFDEGGHAGYALAIREGGLPHPYSGWSTFHPPLSHLVSAGAWALLEPFGARASLVGLRLPSMLGVLAAAFAVFVLARDRTGSPGLALAAATLACFVPVAQLAATMIGNEGLGAGLAALTLLALARLQQDPRDLRLAAAAGLCAGLAAITKFTGLWCAAACALPFLRRDLGRDGLRAGAACAALIVAIAAPVYLRNWASAGTPLPMTRTREPMRFSEAQLYAAPRRLADYVSVPLACGRYPYVQVQNESGLLLGMNRSMQSVPCLAYAGIWFDPFATRTTPEAPPAAGAPWGVALLYAGLVPTLLCALGFGRIAARSWRSRGRAPEAPLALQTLFGLGSFVAFTWLAPSLAAAKASYLLPLLAPAGVAFALGAAALPPAGRRAGVALSLAAVALATFVFTTGTVFGPGPTAVSLVFWRQIGAALPASHIAEAAERLLR
jgi:4-amino-4-deoxy-L-arabinose transferase-like glycosyltransferase